MLPARRYGDTSKNLAQPPLTQSPNPSTMLNLRPPPARPPPSMGTPRLNLQCKNSPNPSDKTSSYTREMEVATSLDQGDDEIVARRIIERETEPNSGSLPFRQQEQRPKDQSLNVRAMGLAAGGKMGMYTFTTKSSILLLLALGTWLTASQSKT